MVGQRIVVVEDDPDIRALMTFTLTREGFQVSTAADGEEGLTLVAERAPALVILDLLLPRRDGLEVCRILKAQPETRGIPIVMVTAKGEEPDVVLGLGLGADDYVTKPFSPKVLVARVQAVLRRARGAEQTVQGAPIVQPGLLIDESRHRVEIWGEPRDLTATEFRLLHFLASRPGRVFTRDQLISRAIGDAAVVIDRNVDVHISAIRRKLGDRGALLETVRGVGYRFRELE